MFQIIISPAKKMKVDTDSFAVSGLPRFLTDTEILMRKIQSLSLGDVRELWKCNDALTELNFQRFRNMDLRHGLTPAIMAYEGLQYRHMAPGVLTQGALAYIGEHLSILSGFYGLLRPFEGVTPYRLEMQAKLSVEGCRDLYEFWGNRLYRVVTEKSSVIVNLASREYSRCIEQYITDRDRWITVEFGELVQGKIRQKGTLAKMARGEMVRFLAENNIREPEGIKEFRELGFDFCGELSSPEKYVFVKEK